MEVPKLKGFRDRSDDSEKAGALAKLYEIGPLRLRKNTLKTVKAFISQENLQHNAKIIRQRCGSARICAVVKANGYGHDARLAVGALNNECAESFAVSTIEEAEQIRPFVSGRTILVTCPLFHDIDPQLVQLAQLRGFHCSVCSIDALAYIQEHLIRNPNADLDRQNRLNIHLKIDTGMTRLGCSPQEAPLLIESIRTNKSLKLAGIYTHLATADDDLDYARRQLSIYREVLVNNALDNPRDRTIVKHVCNTSAALQLADDRFDMARIGIGLFGYTNIDDNLQDDLDLRPVMRVEAPVVQVKKIPAGSTCGYGRTYTAPHDMIIGIIPMGYADGLLRCLSGKMIMLAGNVPAPVIGRISMDLTIVDLSNAPKPREGMTLTVIDDRKSSPCSVGNLAAIANTIPYEIFISIGNRIKRELV